MTEKSKFSPVLFIVSVLCFFLPFVTVSCSGQKIATLTGVQLATGATINQPQMFGPAIRRSIPAEPLAALAAIGTLSALGLAFLPNRAAIGAGISGAIAAVFLLLLKLKLDNDMTNSGRGMLQLEYGAGYTLSLLCLIAGTSWCFYVYSQARKGKLVQQPALTINSGTVCPSCQTVVGDGKFCTSCGKAVG